MVLKSHMDWVETENSYGGDDDDETCYFAKFGMSRGLVVAVSNLVIK